MWKYLPASVCSADTGGMTLQSGSRESRPEPSATSSGTSTVKKSSKPGSKMVSSTMLPSGTMSESLTAHPGVEEWISSLPHRPASPTPRQGAEREPAMIETSSPIHSESLARYSPDESMWKTSPDLQLNLKMEGQATSQKSLVNFPRSGMTVDGTLYPLKTQAHRTCVNGGFLLPTPVADGDRRTNYKQGGTSLGYAARQHFPTPRAIYGEHPGMKDPSHLTGAAMQWNTPNTMDSLNCKSQKALDYEYNTARPGRTNPNNLRDQVAVQEGLRLWPTPATSQDYKPVRPLAPSEADGTHGTMLVGAVGDKHPDHIGGQLSSTWVEWLMGIPVGWSALDPLPEGAYAEWLEHMEQGTWWAEERGLPRLAEGQKDRVNRLKCLGNGIVPASGALAFITLEGEA